MASLELLSSLFKRRSVVENCGQSWESLPEASSADASSLKFGSAPSAKEWLKGRGCEITEEDPLKDAFTELLEGRGAQPSHAPVLEDYPQPPWLDSLAGTMNVGIVGNSGVGKSLLINQLRRAQPGSEQWAPVGVSETTTRPTMYAFPGNERVRLWDLPGAGTPDFPQEGYVAAMGLRYFDSVLVATAGRFTSLELSLVKELEARRVPFFMVRTKVDMDVWNNWQDNGATEDATLHEIRADLARHGATGAYLVSAREPERYDMRQLLSDAFPGLRRYREALDFVFCMGAGESAWLLPSVLPPTLAHIQGHWHDTVRGADWIVDGCEAHVTLADGLAALARLEEAKGGLWCNGEWWLDSERAAAAREAKELRWTPRTSGVQPLLWRRRG